MKYHTASGIFHRFVHDFQSDIHSILSWFRLCDMSSYENTLEQFGVMSKEKSVNQPPFVAH